MTTIAFQDGKPLLRDGKVGVGQNCCCDPPGCFRCIRDGEWDCQYTTQETCEDCTRTYTCQEARQTECDGDCPEGFTPGDPVTVQVEPTPGCGGWNGYWASTAHAIATVGCGQILSVAIDPAYHGEYSPPSGFARWGRTAPTVTATVTQSGGSASGAVLAVNLSQSTDSCGFPYWYIESISVVSPGSGYTMFEPEGNAEITLEDAPGDIEEGYGAYAYVTEVDEDGGIVSVYVSDSYNRWHESAEVPAIITPHTVSIGGGGSGAVVTPVIDTNTSSPTFGHITGFTVTNGGSGYASLCTRSRSVASCDECPPRTSPEYAFCNTFVADDGKPCGTWTPGFPGVEPPCCDSCLVRPNPPWPPSPTRTCVPTLNVEENTSDYIKTSSVSGPPPSWYGAIPWNEAWLSEHSACTFVWVQDYVSQTNETGTYCAFALQFVVYDANGYVNPNYQPPQGCELNGGGVYCHVYNRKYWVRYRLFLVDCRTKTMSDVTADAFSEPIEWEGCLVPSERFYCTEFSVFPNCLRPACSPPQSDCAGANPGFLSAEPTLECGE